MKRIFILLTSLLLFGCLGMPETVKPVNNFEIERYLGKWYEIARLDHSFEEGLEQVSAEYIPCENEGVIVVNRGFDPKNRQWQQAEGKAFFVNQNDVGHLQVSFFGPFYSSYVVFEIDRYEYQYAFVSGPSLDYLWLLSRSPVLDQTIIDEFIKVASEKGFDTEKLIFVKH